MKNYLTSIKMTFGFFGVCDFFYRTISYERYFKMGSEKADSLHVVLINNHGFYAYITKKQNENLIYLDLFFGILMLAMICVDIYQRKNSKNDFFKKNEIY